MDTSAKNADLNYVLDKFDTGHITIPAYQRDQTAWNQKLGLRSCLLRTLFEGLPIPPVWLMGALSSGYCELVDGLQRLTTFSSFRQNKWALKIPELPELTGKRYLDLSSNQKDHFLNYNIAHYSLPLDSSFGRGLGETMFRRLNKGQPLSPAELHHGEMSEQERQTLKVFVEILHRYVYGVQWSKAKQRMVQEHYTLSGLVGMGIGWTKGTKDSPKEVTVYGQPMRKFGTNHADMSRRVASNHLVQIDASELSNLQSKFEDICRRLGIVFGIELLSSAATTTNAANLSVIVIRFAALSKIQKPDFWWVQNRERIIEICSKVDASIKPGRASIESALSELEVYLNELLAAHSNNGLASAVAV